jgi:hypothetical protein
MRNSADRFELYPTLHFLEHAVRTVAVGRVTAAFELTKADVRRPACDPIDLLHRAIFILLALYRQHAAGD